MTPELFTRAGRATFGDNWFRPMAEALGVRPDTVKHWSKGQSRMPPLLGVSVMQAIWQHCEKLEAITGEISGEAGQ